MTKSYIQCYFSARLTVSQSFQDNVEDDLICETNLHSLSYYNQLYQSIPSSSPVAKLYDSCMQQLSVDIIEYILEFAALDYCDKYRVAHGSHIKQRFFKRGNHYGCLYPVLIWDSWHIYHFLSEWYSKHFPLDHIMGYNTLVLYGSCLKHLIDMRYNRYHILNYLLRSIQQLECIGNELDCGFYISADMCHLIASDNILGDLLMNKVQNITIPLAALQEIHMNCVKQVAIRINSTKEEPVQTHDIELWHQSSLMKGTPSTFIQMIGELYHTPLRHFHNASGIIVSGSCYSIDILILFLEGYNKGDSFVCIDFKPVDVEFSTYQEFNTKLETLELFTFSADAVIMNCKSAPVSIPFIGSTTRYLNLTFGEPDILNGIHCIPKCTQWNLLHMVVEWNTWRPILQNMKFAESIETIHVDHLELKISFTDFEDAGSFNDLLALSNWRSWFVIRKLTIHITTVTHTSSKCSHYLYHSSDQCLMKHNSSRRMKRAKTNDVCFCGVTYNHDENCLKKLLSNMVPEQYDSALETVLTSMFSTCTDSLSISWLSLSECMCGYNL
jgi:hypothetical protein